ncbi:hypothetical protein [Hymenobacter koreensis]|uniref:Uncharacterized protein n=1 Tax=Hymenobacter koreensis TaxID=1084523 RepID=A0ABP8J6N5_9BACT
MKNALLALALFAFVGSASAHDGKDEKGKKGKKAKSGQSHCASEAKEATATLGSTPSCCSKKGAVKTAEVKTTEATPAVKSL